MASLDENPQDPFEPIAVIGLSALLPDADDITAFWQNILDAKVSFKTVPSDRWIESDFWPIILNAIKQNNIKCILINARISPTSFKSFVNFFLPYWVWFA